MGLGRFFSKRITPVEIEPPPEPAELFRGPAAAAAAQPDPAADGSFPRVVLREGVYHLQHTADAASPFMQNNAPLQTLGAGWSIHALYTGFAPILLLELQSETGDRATWYFDCTPQFIGNTIAGLDPNHRSMLIRKATAVLAEIFGAVTGEGSAGSEQAAASFFELCQTTRIALGQACREAVLPAPAVLPAARMPEINLARPRGLGKPSVIVPRRMLTAALEIDFQTQLMTALDDGYLSWPSLNDGRALRCSGMICFNDFAFAYRFADETSGLVFYVLASEHNARCLGLYIPSEGLIVATNEWNCECVRGIFPDLSGMLLDYVCRFGATLVPYLLRKGSKAMAATLRESHLGHQLWNEFTGLEDIVNRVQPGRRPLVFSFGGRANGCFGPLTAVFPELAGQVRDELHGQGEIVEYAHRHDLLPARFTRMFVSAALRRRIAGYLESRPEFQAAIRHRRSMAGKLVLIGLRVENRTAIDLAGFVSRMVDHIARIAPGSIVVLDGQNRQDDQRPVGSFADHLASRSPLDVEMEICRAVAASAVGKPVTVVTTTGDTVASSIAWASEAACFIAIWGAGLAKYRWICNKPGLIVSSRYHLLNPQEMSIYHHPSMMEDPAPLSYVDPGCIDDRPEATQLVPVNGVRHMSFEVNEALFFPQLTAFLQPYLSNGVPP
jgi:hypothetical protein